MARVVAQGDTRPMAQSREAMDDLRRILAGRAPFYAKADATLRHRRQERGESFAGLLAVGELLGAARPASPGGRAPDACSKLHVRLDIASNHAL